MIRNTKHKKIAVFDAETDPFLVDRVPAPFCCGFYDGQQYLQEWGPRCIANLLQRIVDLEEDLLIYVHNGGKFDFWFMFDYIDAKSSLFIINGRLVEFALATDKEIHKHSVVFRDSLAIIPVPLAQIGKKTEIDYNIFEKERRNKPRNRKLIESYLKDDCTELYKTVIQFAETFNQDGNVPISIGQASIREITKLHEFQKMTEASDAALRPFYMGGRVQCFEAGILKGPFHVYDVNGMYPAVMSQFWHPLLDAWDMAPEPPPPGKHVWFAQWEGTNRQAIPCINNGGLAFDIEHSKDTEKGYFLSCSHELEPAMKAGMIDVEKWKKVIICEDVGNFRRFVEKWQAEKVASENKGDKAGRQFAKLVLNSGYGKAGQNPENFREYKLLLDPFDDEKLQADGYLPENRISDEPFIEIWSRPSKKSASHGFYNVAIAASITSGARALLLEGLRNANRPVYTDTDSLICSGFRGHVHPTNLGAWKLEATAEYAAIAGKKLYCLFDTVKKPGGKYPLAELPKSHPKFHPDGKDGDIYPVKWASKGGDLFPRSIVEIARGGEVEHTNQVPSFSLKRGISFISRKFTKTVANPKKFR